mmetsp:Transcript_16387/g.46773  ORF Transcript_16387/g.46773 Transcript_16387/m.46773 type:complete len:111 (+) Transcript_16387:342-674(+)
MVEGEPIHGVAAHSASHFICGLENLYVRTGISKMPGTSKSGNARSHHTNVQVLSCRSPCCERTPLSISLPCTYADQCGESYQCGSTGKINSLALLNDFSGKCCCLPTPTR